jgi:hypothetical protein
MGDLTDKLKKIDNGRFEKIMSVLDISDVCFECGYFNLTKGDFYRCRVFPGCIGATLSKDLISYLNWKLDFISSEEHLTNLRLDRKQ